VIKFQIRLDEGTSAIDRQMARDIENRLLNGDDLTLITITHSLDPSLLIR
jgi:energy-coupling factor transporter ATP-binding protein EcfA2